jgi:archaellum biogenesis protein FlaJ (TadC family)
MKDIYFYTLLAIVFLVVISVFLMMLSNKKTNKNIPILSVFFFAVSVIAILFSIVFFQV